MITYYRDDKLKLDFVRLLAVAGVVAAASSMIGPVGGLASGVLTKSTLTPVLSGAFKYLDKYQIKVCNKLVEMSKKL